MGYAVVFLAVLLAVFTWGSADAAAVVAVAGPVLMGLRIGLRTRRERAAQRALSSAPAEPASPDTFPKEPRA